MDMMDPDRRHVYEMSGLCDMALSGLVGMLFHS